jgi:hypothetical protein
VAFTESFQVSRFPAANALVELRQEKRSLFRVLASIRFLTATVAVGTLSITLGLIDDLPGGPVKPVDELPLRIALGLQEGFMKALYCQPTA